MTHNEIMIQELKQQVSALTKKVSRLEGIQLDARKTADFNAGVRAVQDFKEGVKVGNEVLGSTSEQARKQQVERIVNNGRK